MMFSWRKRAMEAEQRADEAEVNQKRVQSNWPYIRQQVAKARAHREANHFTEIILAVAKGAK